MILGELKERVGDLTGKVHLIIAGGYDERVTENKEYYIELRALARELSLDNHITFVRSFTDTQKLSLLDAATCLLYTPDREHFGIVPVEAMYKQCPVIAVNSGGPLETVLHEHTGYLCDQTAATFADAMLRFVNDSDLRKRLGAVGRTRMINLFSFEAYANHLSSIVDSLLARQRT